MPLSTLNPPFPWSLYSKKLAERIKKPRNIGCFTENDAKKRNVRLAQGSVGAEDEGNWVWIYWLVDPEDGIIVDAKCQVFGQSALLGAADASCDLVVGKNYDQAKRISTEVIENHLKDRGERAAFPKETYPHLNLVIEAMDEAANTCIDIPFAATYVAPPAPISVSEVVEGGYPGWESLTDSQKITAIEEVLDKDIRPYIALDAGGVEVVALKGHELSIAYQGACTSCIASVGATLSYIQQTLRNKIDPKLSVKPEM